MSRKPKFRPEITRVKLNPEQAVLACTCFTNPFGPAFRLSPGFDWDASRTAFGGDSCIGKDRWNISAAGDSFRATLGTAVS